MIKKVNMHDAKTHLSRYVTELQPDDVLVICNRNEPVAELKPVTPQRRPPRLGVARGQFTVTDAFFEPLPEDILKAFNGE